MYLVTFEESDQQRVGALDRDTGEVIDLVQACPELPRDILTLIAMGDPGLAVIQQALQKKTGRLPLSSVKLLAPVPRPARNIFCVGKNYPEHVKEVQSVVASSSDTQGAAPDYPIIFTKAPSSVIGPGEAIPGWLDHTASVDYEGELAAVIGKGGRGISRSDAMQHIYGYTILNDVTSRRMQKKHQQWFLGKSLDGFCPMGPCLVTRDEITDVRKLRVQTYVNNELRQDGYVGDMIFDIPSLIETLSRTMTLETGDIIATGTPAGVGMGFNPPKFLVKGDRVAITIEPIGTLENCVE